MEFDFSSLDVPLDTERLIRDAVAAALQCQDPVRFMEWMRYQVHDYVTATRLQDDLFFQGPEEARDAIRRFGMLLGRQIWNAMPLPDNGFKPRPMRPPETNDPCPCGSGRVFRVCCAQLSEMPDLHPRDLWPVVLEFLPREQRQEVLAAGMVPADVLSIEANRYLQAGKARMGQKLLQPLFDPKITGTGEAHDFALNTLCNIYDYLGYWRKKQQLLQKILRQSPRSPLRSGAWQRLAAIHMDEGDEEAAWQAFERAQRDDPGSSSLGVLEIQLLLAQKRPLEAQERARIWLRRLRRTDLSGDTLSEFFEAVASDPHAAMLEIGLEMSQGAGERLFALIPLLADRPLPDCHLVVVPPAQDEPAELRDLKQGRAGLVMTSAAGLRTLERQWRQVYGREEALSVEAVINAECNPWDPEAERAWCGWLEDNPRAFDSLLILDDLVNALQVHPQSRIPGWDERMLRPFLLRSYDLLEKYLRDRPEMLEWGFLENRPALRLLVHRMDLEIRAGDGVAARRYARWLLELNPIDNHGIRAQYLNWLLRDGRDGEAVDLAKRYPGDGHPELAFGWALACYRLARRNEADRILAEALERFPKVPRMLLSKSPKRPRAEDGGVRSGGERQAWEYREEMLDLWLSVPGALEWLRRIRRAPR